MIGVYRGHSTIFEFLGAGSLVGALYKFHLGPKGMASGGIFGGLFGLIGGFASTVILKFSGQNMEDLRYWQYKWREKRDKTIFDLQKSAPEEDVDAETSSDIILLYHHKTPGRSDVTLNALDDILAGKIDKTVKDSPETNETQPLSPGAAATNEQSNKQVKSPTATK